MKDRIKNCVLFCVKWRYLLALVIFVLCVGLKLHGSSIAEYNKLFSNVEEYNSSDVILGKSRAIRSDEWLVHTPYYMSQQYNNFEKSSNMMSLDGQDMIVGYNAPVKDVTIIAKPFTWGYMLLGNEYGLSWYWCSKMILLALLCFELFMIITRKNIKISLLGMIMIVCSPVVQWWFVPHMVDVFFWGIAILVLAYHFFVSKGWWRILFSALLSCSMITFVLALFPSLQLPIGLVDIVLLTVFLIRDKRQITFKKKDTWLIIVIVGFAIAVLAYTIFTSKDAIMLLYNTVYPGKRVSLGGGAGMKSLFTDITTFALPYKNIPYSNSCEASTFIHFAPIFLILYPLIYKNNKKNKNMIVGNALLVCIIVMGVFMMIGFPELLAKLTGFSYINRMNIVYGLVATMFTIWGVNMVWQSKPLKKKYIIGAILVYAFLNICFIGQNELSYLSWKVYAVIICVLAAMIYLMLCGYKKIFVTGMCVIMFVSGCTINPIARGTGALFNHPLEQKIHEIAEEYSDANWITIGSIILPSIGIANGAKMLNAVNFYPDYGKWKIVDPEKKNDDIYNRYAHMVVVIKDKTKFLPGETADSLVLEISYDDLMKMPVKYLLTVGKLENNKYFIEKYDDPESDCYIYERVEKNG